MPWSSRLARVIVLAAIASTAYTVVDWHLAKQRSSPPWKLVPADWAWTGTGSPYLTVDATVADEVTIFSDYTCPSCRRLFLDVLPKSPDGIRRTVRVRHLPASGVDRAMAGALVAICSERLGRFPEIHRSLFDAMDRLNTHSVEALLDATGLARNKQVRECVESAEARQVLDYDIDMAIGLGLDATPTIIVDGKIYRGIPRQLRRLLEKE